MVAVTYTSSVFIWIFYLLRLSHLPATMLHLSGENTQRGVKQGRLLCVHTSAECYEMYSLTSSRISVESSSVLLHLCCFICDLGVLRRHDITTPQSRQHPRTTYSTHTSTHPRHSWSHYNVTEITSKMIIT